MKKILRNKKQYFALFSIFIALYSSIGLAVAGIPGTKGMKMGPSQAERDAALAAYKLSVEQLAATQLKLSEAAKLTPTAPPTTNISGLTTVAALTPYITQQNDIIAKAIPELQTLVNEYLAQQSSLDTINASYAALGYKEPYSSTSSSMSSAALASWQSFTLNDITAAQVLGLVSDRCNGQPMTITLTNLGIKIDTIKFDAIRAAFCKTVQTAAHLKTRYDQFKAMSSAPIPLLSRSASQKFDFPGNMSRTVGVGFDLTYRPDSYGTAESSSNGEPYLSAKLSYNSWMKWSDDNPVPLNFIATIREMKDNPDPCGLCIPIVSGNPALAFCTQVVSATASTVRIKNCANIKWEDRNKQIVMPEYTISAPFGYLAELQSMGTNAKADMLTKASNQIADMLSSNNKIQGYIAQIQTAKNAIQQAQTKMATVR